MPLSSSPTRTPPARSPWADAPALTVVLVVAALTLVIVPVAQMLGPGAGSQHGLEPFMELVAVLLGLLVVSVSLHTLDPSEQARANVLVAGFGVAAVCNFLHGVLAHSTPVHMPSGTAHISLWLSSWARVVEVVTLLLTAARLAMPGPAKVWLAASGVVALLLVGSAMGPLPGWFAAAAGGSLRQYLAFVLVVALGVAAVWLHRNPGRRERVFAWAAVAFLGGELVVGLMGGHSSIGGPLAHGLRVLAYALLYQAVFDAGIRAPFARVQEAERRLRESEGRLSLLGRNLPHSVLFQVVRELDGSSHFVHMGDAIERLNGVTVQEVMADFRVLYRQVLPEDIDRLRQAERQSFLTMTSMEAVFRVRRTDGQIRWMHLSSSPRLLDDGRVLWDGVQTDITAHRLAEEAAHAHEALMANMLRQVPGGVARLDRDLRVLYVNAQQASWLYRKPEELQDRLLQEVIPADVFARMQPHFAKAFAGETAVFENRMDGPDGLQVRHTTIAPESVTEQGVPAVVLFAYDLTGLKRVEAELADQKAHLARVVNAMPDMVFLKDASGVYLSVNPVFERFAGRSERQIVGCNDFDLVAPAEAERFRKYDQRAMQAWQPLVYEETLTFAEDGYRGQFETIKTPIRDLTGRVTGVLGVCRDITDRKRAEQEIERLAFFDALTGLPNRRLLLDRLQRSIAACQRTKNLGALLFIDLDNFKDLNDTLGHDMGDQLLSQVATRLVGSVREADTVARFGGDEFVVMLEALAPELQSAATQAETVAEKLLANLNQPFDLDGAQHYSTPSIGITLFGDERLTVDELLKRADLAMYQAKSAGRNGMRFFDPRMQAEANARASLENDLRQSLSERHFILHYQPQVDAQGQLIGAEALVRWQHPRRGLVAPNDFIPLAESTGLILPLGRWILHSACAQLVTWAAHPQLRHINLAVNVSARQFHHRDFVEDVLAALTESGANPARLELELTESVMLEDAEGALVLMQELKGLGVRLSMDDFGTGYSSLSYLRAFPFDGLKIDRSFMTDLHAADDSKAIIQAIIGLGHALSLTVTAEGVETREQLELLRQYGCDEAQGYLFCKPVPGDEIERLLRLQQSLLTATQEK